MAQADRFWLWGGLVLGAAAGGCALTPPPETPDLVAEIRTSDSFYTSGTRTADRPEVEAWWRDVGGGELDALVGDLRRNSLVLKEARLEAEQAREGAQIARGQRLPTATAIGDVSANRTRGFGGAFSWSEAYTAGVLLDFNTDVFGGLRASQRAADLSAMASELAIEASEQREIAILARNWVSAATLQRRLDLARRTADSFRSTYDLTNQRYMAGSASVSASDVQIALQNLETALVDIPQIEADLAQQLLVIDEQLARAPGTTEAAFTGRYTPLRPFEPPVGRPAALLASRPDVAIAELRYLAALEDVGAARAAVSGALAQRIAELPGRYARRAVRVGRSYRQPCQLADRSAVPGRATARPGPP